MTALLLLAITAFAWDLVPDDPVDLPEGEAALALVEVDSEVWLVTGGEASWSLVDPLTGTASITGTPGAAAAAGFDGDGDGSDDLLLCLSDGLWLVYTGADPVGPLHLDEATCTAAVGLGLDGEHVPSAADGTEVRVYSDIPETGGSYPAVTGAAPVLVGDGTALAVAAPGDWSVIEVRSTGVGTTSASGKVGDLAVHDGAWAWSLPEEAQVVLDGAATDVGNRPGPLASADLDGDGVHSLVISYPTHGEVGVLLDGGAERIFDLGLGVEDLLAADLDGDGCDDLLLATETAVVPVLVEGCDGTVETGDPCQGTELGLHTSGPPEEGRPLAISLAMDLDCFPAGSEQWVVVEGKDIVACREGPQTMECDLLDDGLLRVRARSVDPEGAVLGQVELSVMVENRAPELLWFPQFMNLGEVFESTPLEARDVPADTVTFELLDGPEGMTVTPDGHLSYRADTPGWLSLTLVLRDEDRGEQRSDIWFEVWDDGGGGGTDTDDGGGGEAGCCCGSAAAAGMLPLALLVALPRRRMGRG